MIRKIYEPYLYLSKDKEYLVDAEGNFMFEKCELDGKLFYQPIGVESPAYEKVCTGTSVLKVCVQWNDGPACSIWDDVDICSQWELVSNGYSNIS